MMDRYDAPVIGLVVDVDDPEQLGRVKVSFPWLAAEGTVGRWAPILRPLAGKEHGFYYMPEIDDEAVVAFQFGDFNHPIVLGFLHNAVDRPPVEGIDTNVRRVRTVAGHKLDFDDRGGSKSVRLSTGGGHQLELHDDSGFVEVKTTRGHSIRMEDTPGQIRLETSGGTTITLENTPSSIELKTTTGVTVTISDTGGVSVSAPMGAVSVSSLTAEVNASASLSVTAPMVTVNSAMATFTGVVKCSLLMTQSVISPVYTPGAGNIW